MNMPKVSVILPCYNVADYMDNMFASLRSQTLKDIEIICVDDKSTDNTIRRQYESDHQRRHHQYQIF